MLVRVLGSAAGGGVPQWNCLCPVCESARRLDGAVRSRTQSSLAVSDGGGRWFLINASPDLRAQIEGLPLARANGMRSARVEAVLLTDAEIDHTAGLLLLRESPEPLRVFSTEEVRAALTVRFPVLRMLDSYCGVEWTELPVGSRLPLPGSSLAVEAFPVGGDAPLYMEGEELETGAIGLTIFDERAGTSLTYAPGLALLDTEILDRFASSDCVLVDGTFWREHEMAALGLGERSASDMGHLPLAPPDGTLETLGRLGPRTILVHINNTNPILFEGSPERALVEEAGVEIAFDGLEVELV